MTKASQDQYPKNKQKATIIGVILILFSLLYIVLEERRLKKEYFPEGAIS